MAGSKHGHPFGLLMYLSERHMPRNLCAGSSRTSRHTLFFMSLIASRFSVVRDANLKTRPLRGYTLALQLGCGREQQARNSSVRDTED